MKKLWIFIIILTIFGQLRAQTNLVDITTTITGGNQIAAQLNDINLLADRTLVTIRNVSQMNMDIVVEAKLTGNNLVIKTNRNHITSANYINLASFASTVLSGVQIRELFDVNNVQFFEGGREVPAEHFFSMADGSGRIPEGNYQLCFEAYLVDFQTGLPRYDQPINTNTRQCVNILAKIYDPPILQSINSVPLLGGSSTPFQMTPTSDGSVLFRWQAPAGLPAGTPLRYDILIAEIAPGDTRDPNQVIRSLDIPSAPIAFYREEIRDPARIVTYQIMPVGFSTELQPGYTYAVQVTAVSEDVFSPLPFRNNGRSQVYAFTWGTAAPAASPITLSSYPGADTYMPFRGAPIIIKYGPYSNNYKRFRSHLSILNSAGGDIIFDRDIAWNPNPLTAQRNATGDPTLDQARAQHIAISQAATNPGYIYYKYRDRGAKHNWTTDITITDGTTNITESLSGAYYAGMDKPTLKKPENESRQDTGKITFLFKTAEEPAMSTLSPFDVVQASRTSGTGSYDISIDEKAVLEVSKTPDFAEIYKHEEFTLNKEFMSSTISHEQLSWSDVRDYVYKDETAELEFVDPGTYYWRVRWLKDPTADWNTGAYNISDIWKFTIGGGDSTASPNPVTRSADCATPCVQEYTYEDGTTNPMTIAVGDHVWIGQFDMEITSITSEGGTAKKYTGKGVITNFGFIIDRVMVNFTNIRIAKSAGEKRVFEGNVSAAGGGSPEANIFHLAGSSQIGPAGLMEIGSGAGSPALSVPFGWDQEIDGHQIIAKIDTINFSPTNARARFTLGYNMPGEFAGHPVVFSTDVCVGPGGFKDDFEISLDRDLDIGSASDQEYDVVIKGRRSVDGGTTADEDKVTKLSWDCNGFKSLTLGMEVKFSRDAVVPENEETGEIETAGRVSGFMTIVLDRTRRAAGEEWGFIGNISFPKSFQFTGLPGWGFKVVDAIFDFSDGKNDTNMHFPSGYDFSLLGSGSDERLRNTWQGFYLKTLRVNIPKALTDGDNTSARRKSFQTTDILVDKTGFTGFIEANNVAEASESGWRISLDTVRLGIMQTRSVSGRLAGSMGAPFFTDSSRMNYSSNLAVGTDGKVEYDFLINVPSDKDLKMKLWQAKMKLDRSSFIRFSISTARSNAARFEGALNGEIGLSDDISEVPGLSMKGIKFENFAFDTEDPRFFKFSRANRTESDGQMVFSFASPQHTAGGFPLNITDISMNMGTGEGGAIQPRLGFTTELTLSDLGFKASFGMDIVGQMSLSPLDFSIVGVDVKEIGIACEFNGFELDGQLQFYKDHPTFGNGIYGKITATLPMGITGKLEARFGNVGSAANPRSYYDYWYVDGLIKINPGITIFSGFAIYGFGGGAYYHMKMNTKPLASQAQSTQSASSDGGNSTATYVPSETTGLGLMATVLLGTQPNADVFNMDVTLLAQFSTSGGLETIQFEGNGYIMNQLTERADAPPIRANVVFGYYNTPEAEYVQGTFDVFLNIRDVIKGKGENNKLVSSELYAGISGANAGQWWFYMGKDRPLDQRSGLLIDIPGLTLDASSYIMVGHGIPADLPPLPEFISSVLNEPSQLENQLTNINNRVRSNAVMSSGQGFAFGTSFDLSTQFNFLMFYAKLRLVLGFDANISQNDSRVCAETGTAPGINGWYAQGQAFAGIEGDIGIAVDLFFVKGNFSILNARAAIAMTAKLPNPNYFQGRAAFQYSILEGAVTGRCNFNMEFGQKCTVVSNDPLAGLSFINEMKMSDNSDPANVFSDVVTAFNFPVNQVLEIEEESSGEQVIRRFRPYVFDFNLKKGNTSVSGDNWYVTDQNYLAVLSLSEAMDPETNYTATIELRVKEYLPDGRSIDVMKEGKLAKEVRELHFITGERPDHILEENVVRSYPLIGQAHYLQGELKSGDKAFVKIRRQDYLFNTQTEVQTGSGAQVETIPAYTHRFVARFTSANGGDHIDRDIVYNPSTDLISFDVPTLKNQQTYRLQILKITSPNTNAIQQALQSGTRIPPYKTIQNVEKRVLGTVKLSEINSEGNNVTSNFETNVSIRKRTAQSTGAVQAKGQTTVLYEYVFGTSRYNTFREKINGVTLGNAQRVLLLFRKLDLTSAESFDELEAQNSADKESLIQIVHRKDSRNNALFYENNTQFRRLNTLISDFDNARELNVRTALPPVELTNNWSELKMITLPNNYGLVSFPRDIKVSYITRLNPSKMEFTDNSISLSGSFTPLIAYIPSRDRNEEGNTSNADYKIYPANANPGNQFVTSQPTAITSILAASGSANSGVTYSLVDAIDPIAASFVSKMKNRVNGYLNATLILSVPARNAVLPIYTRLDALTPGKRTALTGLKNQMLMPVPVSGERVSLEFNYRIPLHDGKWKTTGTYYKEYILQ